MCACSCAFLRLCTCRLHIWVFVCVEREVGRQEQKLMKDRRQENYNSWPHLQNAPPPPPPPPTRGSPGEQSWGPCPGEQLGNVAHLCGVALQSPFAQNLRNHSLAISPLKLMTVQTPLSTAATQGPGSRQSSDVSVTKSNDQRTRRARESSISQGFSGSCKKPAFSVCQKS